MQKDVLIIIMISITHYSIDNLVIKSPRERASSIVSLPYKLLHNFYFKFFYHSCGNMNCYYPQILRNFKYIKLFFINKISFYILANMFCKF